MAAKRETTEAAAKEQRYYTPGSSPAELEVWRVTRILNGDETDRGIRFSDLSTSTTTPPETFSVSGDLAAVALAVSELQRFTSYSAVFRKTNRHFQMLNAT